MINRVRITVVGSLNGLSADLGGCRTDFPCTVNAELVSMSLHSIVVRYSWRHWRKLPNASGDSRRATRTWPSRMLLSPTTITTSREKWQLPPQMQGVGFLVFLNRMPHPYRLYSIWDSQKKECMFRLSILTTLDITWSRSPDHSTVPVLYFL
jgi:hypothetical protein